MVKIIAILLIGFSGYSQISIYNKTTTEGKFQEYQTKSGHVLKLGDTITIGYPFTGSFFTFITQGGTQTSPILSNKKVVISKIRSIGTPKRGYKTYILFGGYGISVYIDYESALEKGEIKPPN